MKRLVEFPLEEGGSILVQIDEPDTGGTVRAGRDDVIEKARDTLEDALNRVLPAAKSVVGKLQSMENRPKEVEVNFGIKLSAQAGAFIAATGAEANFGVTVRWTKPSKETTP